MPDSSCVLIATDRPLPRLRRALEHHGHRVIVTPLAESVETASDGIEAVVVAAGRDAALALARRLKTRFQMPLLPVVALVGRPPRPREGPAPDAWLPTSTRPRDVVERVEELVRIRRTERELVRLNSALAELAAENGRLYDRARRDAEATTLLLRELQHRVRNNLAAIQALLVLERHREPPRPLPDALDVAIARLRGMAALQDSLEPQSATVNLAPLARAVCSSVIDVFGASGQVRCEVLGGGTLPARSASAVAIVLNELVTNALKHAQATTVRVRIQGGAGALQMDVADDGRGMPTPPPDGSGLRIARAVVRNELAGTLAFIPSERGTHVRVTVPAQEREREGGARSSVPLQCPPPVRRSP
jgi:two-component sensor histidine kinase